MSVRGVCRRPLAALTVSVLLAASPTLAGTGSSNPPTVILERAQIAAFDAWQVLPGADGLRWGPHIDIEARPGTDRSLGEIGLFVPLGQSERSLLFADLRGRFDGQGGVEGNFGLGLRHMTDAGFNLGLYGYFDRRRTPVHHNHFNQITVGAELLSQDWDLRANAYLPVGPRVRQADGLNTASLSGTTVTFRGGEERSLAGFDAEIGWRLPVTEPEDNFQLRAFAGGYRFTASGVPEVAGPRGRVEAVFDEVPGLWQGSRLSLGLEVQHDRPRGTQTFATVRLRIPLQPGLDARPRNTGMARRMTDPVIRDIDVVTQAGAYGPAETASRTASGQPLTVLDSGTTADLPAAVAAAGANSTVVLTGSFNTGTEMTTLQAGQTVMGAGTLTVQSPSGRTATLTTPGATVAAATTISTITTFEMANDSTLSGLTISNTGTSATRVAVRVIGVNNVTIANNTITATGGSGGGQALQVGGNSSGILIENNTLSASATNNAAIALNIVEASVTVRNNSLSASTSGTANTWYTNYNTSATVLEGSTGNSVGGGTCNVTGGTPVTGSIQFTNAAGCP